MARGFGSTLGSATTDKILSAFGAVSPSGTRTWSIWTYRNGGGGGSLGRVFHKGTSAATDFESFFNRSGSSQMSLLVRWNSASIEWAWNQPSASAWVHMVLTYDNTLAANNPALYYDGVLQTLVSDGSPTGSVETTTQVYCLGNRSSDGARNWDGSLAEFGVWDVILTAGEIAALGQGYAPPLVRPQSLVEYMPLLRDNVSRKLAAPTVTGTAIQPHPRVIYPVGPGFISLGAPIGGGSQTLLPTAIASAEAHGTATLQRGSVTVAPTAIDSSQAFGTTVVAPGSIQVAPSSIGSAEVFGSATITLGAITLLPTAIGSEQAFGTLVLVPGQIIAQPSSIVSAQTFGTLQLNLSVAPAGIDTGFGAGIPVILPGAVTLLPSGIISAAAFGTLTITNLFQFLILPGISSAEAFGSLLAQSTGALKPALFDAFTSYVFDDSERLFDRLIPTHYVRTTGISSGAMGAPTLIPGAVTIVVSPYFWTADIFGTLFIWTQDTLTFESEIFTSQSQANKSEFAVSQSEPELQLFTKRQIE